MEDKITINQPNGQKQVYDIIFSFISKIDNKKYIAYTNYEKDANNNIICYSALYDNNKVLPVQNEDAIKVIDSMLNTISEGAKIRYKISG